MKKKLVILPPKAKLAICAFDLMVFLFAAVFCYRLSAADLALSFVFSKYLWTTSLILISVLYLTGSYDLDEKTDVRGISLKLAIALGLAGAIMIFIPYLFQKDRPGPLERGVYLGAGVVFFNSALVYRAFIAGYFSRLHGRTQWLFVIGPNYWRDLHEDLLKMPMSGTIHLLSTPACKDEEKFIGTLDDLPEILESKWTSIVVGLKRVGHGDIPHRLLMQAKLRGHNVQDLSRFYESAWAKIPVYYVEADWFIRGDGFNLIGSPVRLRLKRFLDVLLAAALLSVVWPLMILVALAVKIENHGPCLYRQIRMGRKSIPFTIYKFRSMYNDAEKSGARWAQEHDPRVTPLGRFIRRYRLDELPQLLNVLKGDMSFIGPRPERPEFTTELEKSIPYYEFRHVVRPGLTGWAQVRHPYGSTTDDAKEKLQYELYYIKNHSLILDLLIMVKTVRIVLFGQGF